MRIEEHAGQLEAENAALREQIRQLLVFVAENAALKAQVSCKHEWPNWRGGWHKTARIAASRRQARDWSASDRKSGG